MSEGLRAVLISDVVLELLLAAERMADPTITAHRIDYGTEHRDLVTYFVPKIEVVREVAVLDEPEPPPSP